MWQYNFEDGSCCKRTYMLSRTRSYKKDRYQRDLYCWHPHQSVWIMCLITKMHKWISVTWMVFSFTLTVWQVTCQTHKTDIANPTKSNLINSKPHHYRHSKAWRWGLHVSPQDLRGLSAPLPSGVLIRDGLQRELKREFKEWHCHSANRTQPLFLFWILPK